VTTTNPVATKEGFAEVKAAKLSTLGFFMALPPVLVVILFVGLPIFVAFLFSIGYTSGPNRVISIIGQDVYTKENWWGTAQAYTAVFKDERFWPDFALTMVVTLSLIHI
jgi:ABC-type sugar transport system permease subunit